MFLDSSVLVCPDLQQCVVTLGKLPPCECDELRPVSDRWVYITFGGNTFS